MRECGFEQKIMDERRPEREKTKEFALLLLKPMAANDEELRVEIFTRLMEVGEIKHLKLVEVTSREQIQRHYSAAKGKNYHLPTVEYLSRKKMEVFILEKLDNSETQSENSNNTRKGFIKRLRKDIIGPSDPEKTEPYHIRNIVKQRGMEYRKKMDLPEEQKIEGYDFAIDNLIHCSDSIGSALEEITNWYQDNPDILKEYES